MPVKINETIIQPHVPKGRQRFDRAAALDRALELFWRKGFTPTTVGELCAVMGINPPSLYGAFGNKAQLFMEAIAQYERVYWDQTWVALEAEPDVRKAFAAFFAEAARILTSPDAPCGCVVVTGAINVPAEDQHIADALRNLREQERDLFLARLQRGVADGQLADEIDTDAIATSLITLLEGMSIEASGGAAGKRLQQVAACAVRLVG
nr:TetR/AcrR family transcriptional regulator [Novosphingobium panipatense]